MGGGIDMDWQYRDGGDSVSFLIDNGHECGDKESLSTVFSLPKWALMEALDAIRNAIDMEAINVAVDAAKPKRETVGWRIKDTRENMYVRWVQLNEYEWSNQPYTMGRASAVQLYDRITANALHRRDHIKVIRVTRKARK
jgi:hypothetical protein